MQQMTVSDFLITHPSLKPLVIETEGKKSKWGRVVCEWREKSTGYSHLFIPLINLQTGEIYLDCSRKKIYVKFILHTIVRPIQIFYKTLYHVLFPLSIPVTIILTLIQENKEKLNYKQIAGRCLKNSVRSLADCIRTPLYGLAMIVTSIAALVIAPFRPNTLYDLRKLEGDLIDALYWHETDDALGEPYPCFTPLFSLYEVHYRNFLHDDTNYNPQATQDEIGLNNMARSNVRFLRKHYGIFNCFSNNPFKKLDPTVEFISPAYGDVKKALAIT